MSIRNNACFNMLSMSIVLYLAMSNLAWAQDEYGYFQSDDQFQSQDYHGERNGHKGHGRYSRFGKDLDLSTFNELDAVKTDDNYAAVVLEDSILGEVNIQQAGHWSGNKAKVVQSDSIRSEADIWQYGGENTALITQTGQQNKALIAQYGYGNKAWINQDGFNNKAAIIQYGFGSSLSINQTGSNNEAYIVDHGGSNYGISQNGNDFVAIIGGYGIDVYVTQK